MNCTHVGFKCLSSSDWLKLFLKPGIRNALVLKILNILGKKWLSSLGMKYTSTVLEQLRDSSRTNIAYCKPNVYNEVHIMKMNISCL